MVAHDYSMSVYDCPGCQRLRQIKHDFSKSPSECPGCLEKGAIRGGYGTHAATSNAADASAHHATAAHRAPVVPAATSSPSNDDLMSVRARQAAREAVQRMQDERAVNRKIAQSWDAVVAELNSKINSHRR
jgi:hypothetical protein